MKKENTIQPEFNQAINLSLTPGEILSLAPECTVGTTSWDRHTDYYNQIADEQMVASNPRTGLRCRMIQTDRFSEGKAEGEVDVCTQFIVELKIGDGYVIAYYIAHENTSSEVAYLRREAEKTFKIWCAVIGVKLKTMLVSDYDYKSLEKCDD